jgi:selenocysteine lyase/cysteine desulfurase
MSFKEQFPILAQCTYLNTASSGILSSSLLEWRQNHDLEFFNQGSGFRLNQALFLQQVKEKVASFFKAKAMNTFLVPNFSYGFNVFLEGLSGKHHFLLLENDYPSVNYAVKCRGFSCDYIQPDELLETDIFEKIGTLKPTVFAFSIVQYTNGFKIDLEFIKRLKTRFPALLIVADGTQYCGTEDFNFEQSGLDFLAASGYKWMLAGYGNGFVLLKDGLVQHLYTAPHQISLPKESFLQSRTRLSFYFEPGHQDTLSFGSLYQSILHMEEIGMGVIEKKVKSLCLTAVHAFASKGILDEPMIRNGHHSSIFSLNISDQIYQKLLEAKIICLSRGKGTRVGFHFYNTEDDLNFLLRTLNQYL